MEERLKKLALLMDAFRTEWFIYDVNSPLQPTNVNQINTICKQILNLNLTQNDIDNGFDN